MKTRFIVIISILFTFFACKKLNVEPLGPEYKSAGQGFYVIGDSVTCTPSNPNLANQTAVFQARFSAEVTWFLQLKGLESGAAKSFTGMSQDLASSGQSIWNGNHDGLYFFKAGEKVSVELHFLGSEKVLHDTIVLAGVKRFITPGTGISVSSSGGTTPEGFEGRTYNFNVPTWNYGIYSDGKVEISTPFGGQTQRDTMNPSIGEKPVQGKYALSLKGKDGVGPSAYFVGGIQRVLSGGERNSIPSDPDAVYLNVYVYGKGNSNSRLNVGVSELASTPGGGEVFTQQIMLDFHGWKLFSLRLSSLPKESGNGNNVIDTRQIEKVAFNLISSPYGNEVDVTFDMASLTFGSPFDPHK